MKKAVKILIGFLILPFALGLNLGFETELSTEWKEVLEIEIYIFWLWIFLNVFLKFRKFWLNFMLTGALPIIAFFFPIAYDAGGGLFFLNLLVVIILWIYMFIMNRVYDRTPIDFKGGYKTAMYIDKRCPSCTKKLPSYFTTKCPYCTAKIQYLKSIFLLG